MNLLKMVNALTFRLKHFVFIESWMTKYHTHIVVTEVVKNKQREKQKAHRKKTMDEQ